MRIQPDEYAGLRSWFAILFDELFPADERIPGAEPIEALDRIHAGSPAKAREGLATAIGDVIEFARGWRPERVAAVEERLAKAGLPSLAAVRVRFAKSVRRALRRGRIRDEAEYRAVRNAADMAGEAEGPYWPLLAEYEARTGG